MPVTFTFLPSQNQTFELRCEKGRRSLPQADLIDLINQCEQTYYSGRRRDRYGDFVDNLEDLVRFGRTLYGWLDGPEGWLRSHTSQGQELNIYLSLYLPDDMAALNVDTQRVALGLAHLPWELLHDGNDFLMMRLAVAAVPVRQVQTRVGAVAEPQNRPLRLLLMATSPDAPGIAPLQYEAEEANIIQATKAQNQTLDLVVEESGSVEELQSLVQSYRPDYFDVFHLTGHGLIDQGEPCFVTEDAFGQPVFSTARDLAAAFKNRWPRVVFLSGCHTGEVPNEGTVPSMAAALIRAGAGVVLGWARPVYDDTAIVAAEALYQSLAAAATVEEAVRAAQQEMIRRHLAKPRDCPDWHLLRMYRDSREVGALVTPLREKGREKLRRDVIEKEFLDEKGEIKVANRAEFVGRRRPLQRCLQAMQETNEHIGVYIQGMGGLGKSTLAARICTRVRGLRNQFEQVVIVGPLDEQRLLNGLSSKYERYAQIPALLNQPQMSLQGRLQNFFEAIEHHELDKPLLLVLDDFEQNIPKQNVEDSSLRLTVEAYEVLGAIGEALAGRVSRLVVTCRYYEAATLPPSSGRLHVEELYRMSEADIAKKQRLIEQEQAEKNQPVTKATMAKIVEAADGNPRLLEWLTAAAQAQLTSDSLLLTLRETEEAFRENVLATALLAALTLKEQKGLARLSSVWLPIEIALMPEMMWEGAAEQSLNRLAGLGLVEKSEQGTQPTAAYRVSRILEPVLLPVLSEAEWQAAHRAMAQKLYQVWWEESDTSSESQRLEIVRLASLAEEQEIAAVVGDALASHWYSNSRFVESLDFCQRFLTTFEDYRILGTIARSESVLGEVDEALRHYQRALDLCPEEDFGDKAATLSNMAGVIAQQGDIERALQLWQESLDILERIGDVKGKAATLSNMAGVIAQQGDIERALQLWQESLDIKERIGDVQGKAATLNNMAGVIAQQGDIERALQLWQESLDILERIGDVKGKAATLSNMAGVIAQQGDIERALQLWQESLDIKERIGDVKGKAATLNNMAGVIAQQGDIERALQLWQEDLDIMERIGDVQGKAATLSNMAGVIAQQGDIERALQLWQESLDILERIGDVKGKAATLNNMAGVIAQQGDIERALQLWQESLDIKERIGDVKGKAATLSNMAGVIAQQGDIERALQLWQESLDILERIGDVKGKAATLSNMAGVIAQQGDIERALQLWQESLDIKERIGDVKGKAATLNNMAGVIAQQGDIERALQLWQEDLDIMERIGDVQGKAATLSNMAGVIAQQGDIERALQLWQESLDIKERIGDVQGKAATLNNMAGVIAQQGDIERALQLWQESLDILERIGDVKGKAATLSNMAGVIAQQGDIERALQLWQESLDIKERIGDVKGKAATLSNMAGVIAQQGDIERALQLWQEDLDIMERIGDVQGKAATLSNMAGVIAQQGDIERALQLWQESLDIKERIGDVQGKAATLNNMAGVIAQQGDIERALQLWQESLDILERIGDVKGKAATLANLAYWAGETGDRVKQMKLNLQAAAALGQARAYSDLLTVLSNLGLTSEDSGQAYLAQAIWLLLRIQAPLPDSIHLLNALYQRIPKGDPLEALLGTTALFLCQTRGENHPQLQPLQKTSFNILIGAATEQGIDPNDEASLQNWITAQQLNDPALFLPQLNAQLETLIGETWAFDRTPLLG